MNGRATRTARARGGFTIVELVIAMAVMTTTLLAIGLVFERASRSYEEGQIDRTLEAQAHRATDFVVRQFLDAGVGQIVAPPLAPLGASNITYQRAQGWNGAGVDWGGLLTLRLELEEGELDDGADNNGNGLADERCLWWIANEGQPDEERRLVTRWVRELAPGETANGADDDGNGLQDDGGLSFELQGNVLVVRLALERVAYRGRIASYATQTSVRLRN